jgi:hypothetical protein
MRVRVNGFIKMSAVPVASSSDGTSSFNFQWHMVLLGATN